MVPRESLEDYAPGVHQVESWSYKVRPWRNKCGKATQLQSWLGRMRPRDEGFGADIMDDMEAEAEFLEALGIVVEEQPGIRFVEQKQMALGRHLQVTRLRGNRHGSVSYGRLAGSIGRSSSEESGSGPEEELKSEGEGRE